MLPLLALFVSILSAAASLPSSFEWSSTGPLVGPKNDGRNIAGIKDPSIIEIDGTCHLFTDFSEANSVEFHYLDQTPIGTGYRAAPQVFFFEPQNLCNPAGWTAPETFYDSMPDIISDNIGDGNWVDMWVICNSSNCYLFSSDDNGHYYRSETTLANFPSGMTNTAIALEDADPNKLFEASNSYKVENSDDFLIFEAIGSDGARYFRSWTSTSISGTWTPLAATEENPFARSTNVAFADGNAWTKSISHGGMVRTQTDQTLTISPCDMRYMYQGLDPDASGSYNSLPWKLALLTQTNSSC